MARMTSEFRSGVAPISCASVLAGEPRSSGRPCSDEFEETRGSPPGFPRGAPRHRCLFHRRIRGTPDDSPPATGAARNRAREGPRSPPPLGPGAAGARLGNSAVDPRRKPWQRDIMRQLGTPRGPSTNSASGSRLAASAPGDPAGTWTDVNLGSTYYSRYAHAAIYDPV